MKSLKVLLIFVMVVSLVAPLVSAKKAENKIPDYSMMERKDVPDQFKWKISDIYATLDDWKKEKEQVTSLLPELEKASAGWTGSADKMYGFLSLLTEVSKKGYRLYSYASNCGNMELSNPLYQKMKGELRNIFVQMQAKLSFVNKDILELGLEKFNNYLNEKPGLKIYEFGIRETLRLKDYILPSDQQRIVTMTGLFTGSSARAANVLNDVEMPTVEVTLSNGKKVTLNYANYVKYRAAKNPEDRSKVMRAFWKNHKKFENTLAVLLDSQMKQHLFNARIHKYKDCLTARLFPGHIDTRVYYNLIKSVRANLAPLHRYLRLKKEMLGLEKFRYDDVYASSVAAVDKSYTFDKAKTIILKMMKVLGSEYIEALKKPFTEQWIDIYPNKGKQTGAYSSGVYGVHPFVKMNYDGSYSNLSTLAHELGHAMHSYFSNKTQHFENANYSTFLAEIASTFNENVLMNYLLKTEKDDLFKLFIIDGYIERIRGTLFRQVIFAEFELAMHNYVEAGKTLTPDWLNKKYLELTRFYYGHNQGIVQVDDYIENEWSSIPHFYLNYYVYTYSTGIISSMALTENILHGKNKKQNRKKYIEFLSTGGSRPTLETLKLAGVDMTTDAPIKAAFKQINSLLDQMEKIVNKLKKKG